MTASHFDLVHGQARSEIEANPALPAFARTVLTGTDESPRIVTDGTAVAGVLPAYARTGDVDEFEIACWQFAMTPRSLVTDRRHATRTLVSLWEAVSGGLPDAPDVAEEAAPPTASAAAIGLGFVTAPHRA